MMDVFIERMIKKKFEAKDGLLLAGILVACIVVIFASLVILPALTGGITLSFFVTLGALFGAYKLITLRNLEFEYSFTNGFISVDKIMNRSARKRITSFECKEVEEIGEYPQNQTRLQNREVQSRIFASAYRDGRESWYVIVNTKKTGRTLLVFDPDERMLEAIKKTIPAHLRFEVFGRK